MGGQAQFRRKGKARVPHGPGSEKRLLLHLQGAGDCQAENKPCPSAVPHRHASNGKCSPGHKRRVRRLSNFRILGNRQLPFLHGPSMPKLVPFFSNLPRRSKNAHRPNKMQGMWPVRKGMSLRRDCPSGASLQKGLSRWSDNIRRVGILPHQRRKMRPVRSLHTQLSVRRNRFKDIPCEYNRSNQGGKGSHRNVRPSHGRPVR